MEEEMMLMISNPPNNNYSTWKLYENPSYNSHHHHHHQHIISPTYLPPSARKLAACLWELSFIRSIMDSELDMARAKIHELKFQLELERKARKKVESVNKRLCKQLLEERKRRETVEDVCDKLAREFASEKEELRMMKKDIVEEKRMLRMAEVLREERVQMKLTDAKIFFEEKLSELELEQQSKVKVHATMASSVENNSITVVSNNSFGIGIGIITSSSALINNKPEAENPHIKRGIKGFVEFPRVVRAISSRGRQLGSKVECQKAQLRLLLRQKSPFQKDNPIIS